MRTIVVALLLAFVPQAFALTEAYTPGPWDYVFYTFAFCGVAFATLIILAYKEYKWLVYAAFSFLLILNTAGMDGMLAYVVGPSDFVLWVVPFLLNAGIASYGYLIIALRLESPHKLVYFRPVFFILAAVSALLALSTVFWLGHISLAVMWVPVNILFFGMVLGQILPPLTWPSDEKRLRFFIRVFPVVAAFFAVGSYWFYFISVNATQNDFNVLHRLGFLLFAFFSLTIVVWQAFNKTRMKEAAEREVIEAERNEAKMQLALLQADQAYEKALSVAAKHRMQLATVSHDLKQPISALRIAMGQLQRTRAGDQTDKLAKAIDYIDSLSRSYIADGDEEELTDSTCEKEVVNTTVFGNALRQMFELEIAEKNIKCSFVCMDHKIIVEPLSAMRIMTNLISNALAHADASRILVGFRRKGQKVIFQVHDNGCGMSEARLSRVLSAGEKGDLSEGQGLGLSIVQELCRAQDMTFTFNSMPGRGSSVFVEIACLGSAV